MPTVAPVLVMGIGNLLMSDEGVGVRVIEFLRSAYEFPTDAQVIDAGTMGYTILDLLRHREFVLVIDAIDGSGHEPGTVVRLSPDDIADNQVMHSLHDTRFIDVLQAASLIGLTPEAECIGIQIMDMTQWRTELSPPVEAAIPFAAHAAIDILAEHGIEPSRRDGVDDDAQLLKALRTQGDILGGASL